VSRVELVGGQPFLDGRPLLEGAELELKLAGERWIPVRWRDGRCVLELGGAWERETDGAAPVVALPLDFALAELRRGESPARVTRTWALAQFVAAHAPDEASETVDLDAARAHKQLSVELPRLIDDYQERFRAASFDLFHAAARFAAARAVGDAELAEARAELEEKAVQFESTSRWLSALQMMASEKEP
jgi:hypothetical protein